MKAGWRWRIPLQHRTGNGYVYSSSFISDDEARDALVGAVEGEAIAEPRILKFRAGRRERSWVNNCVSVGLASGFLEPLESTSIYLIQQAITYLVELFPEREISPIDRDEFNRLIDMEYDRIRDFLILHYHATTRSGMEFWDYVRTMPIPDTLADKLELFRRRGRVVKYREGVFLDASWIAVYLGQGVVPEGHDLRADAPPSEFDRARACTSCATRSAARSNACPTIASISTATVRWRRWPEMSQSPLAVRTIIVAGGGITGWSTAAALKRRIPALAVTVLPVPSPADALADRIGTTLPSILEFHNDIGISEGDVVSRIGCNFRLGTAFEGWTDGDDYVHAYDDYGRPLGTTSFHLHWVRARTGRPGGAVRQPFAGGGDGPRRPLRPSAGRAGLAAGRLRLRPARRSRALPPDDAGLCAACRRHRGTRHDRRRRVARRGRAYRGGAGRGRRRDQAPTSMSIAPGRPPCCAGSWTTRSRTGATIARRPGAVRGLAAAGRTALARPGRRPPLRLALGIGGTAIHLARPGLCFGRVSDSKAARVLQSSASVEASEAPVMLRQGRRPDPWLRNCVAIGDAAVAIEPLEWTNLHLAHSHDRPAGRQDARPRFLGGRAVGL